MPRLHARSLRRPLHLSLVLAMIAALTTLLASGASAVENRSEVSGMVRLSSGATTQGYVMVLQKDPDPAVTYSEYLYESFGDHVDVDLPPGTYKLAFYSYDTGTEKWYATGAATGVDIDHATPVVVTGKTSLATVTFPVRTITVTAKDQSNAVVPNIELSLSSNDCDYENWRTTNKNGVGVFRDVPTTCAFSLYGYEDNDGTHDDATTTVPAGTGPANVTLSTPRRATVSGKVTNAGSGALGLIDVTAYDSLGDWAGGTVTDSQGNYTVNGLQPGSYTLHFSDELNDYTEEYFDNQADLATASYFTVAANAAVTGKDAQLAATVPGTPTDVDLKGVVSGAGKTLGNVEVTAYRNGVVKGSTVTGRNGKYFFDSLTAGSYQLQFRRLSGPSDELPYVDQWFLNSRSSAGSTPVNVVPDAAGADRNVTLPQWGAITGTVTDNANHAVDSPSFDLFESNGNYADFSYWPVANGYKLIAPPGSYKLYFSGYNEATGTSYVPEYWNNSPNFGAAQAITVTSGGARAGVNAALASGLQTAVAPKINGPALVGSTLVVTPGTWNLDFSAYTYTWLRGITPVGNGATYKVKAADIGAKLSVRVNATNGSWSGTALSASTATVKRPSVTKLTAKSSKAKTVKLTIKVTVPGVVNPGGKVVIKRGTVVVKTNVSIVNGVATVTLTKQPTGQRGYTAVYAGTSAIAGSTSPVAKIKVKG